MSRDFYSSPIDAIPAETALEFKALTAPTLEHQHPQLQKHSPYITSPVLTALAHTATSGTEVVLTSTAPIATSPTPHHPRIWYP